MNPVWQPSYHGKADFSITLDGDFASQAYDLEADQEKMNELGNTILDDYLINWKNPYRFKENSFLVTSIHLGNNGTWIATTESPEGSELTYHAHNVDNTEDAAALQHLFGEWAETTQALLSGER